MPVGDFFKPSVTQVDNAPGYARDNERATSAFATRFINDPSGGNNPFLDLWTRLGGDQLGPARDAASGNSDFLRSLMSRTAPGELQFSPQFSELVDPFSGVGSMNQARNIIAAQAPLFSRALQEGLTRASQTAPNVYSTALAQEGRDITTQALQDYNNLSQQALLEGLKVQQQDQAAHQNFLLGARGLQQGEIANVRQSQLGARDLFERGLNNTASRGLDASGQMFNQGSTLSRLGLDQQSMLLNPTLQLLLGALNFGTPSAYQTSIGPSKFSQFTGGLADLASSAFAIKSLLSKRGGGGAGYWNPEGGTDQFGNFQPGSGVPVRYPPKR